MNDAFLFIAFPYAAITLAVVGTIYRYFNYRYTYSSLSSQFLENRMSFWASVSWHYSIILILTAHVIATILPPMWGVLLANPFRLYFLEVTGWALAILSIVGCGMFIVRRLMYPRVRAVTTKMDWVILIVLFAQVVLGLLTAVMYRWGGLWYLHTAAPWLWSLFALNPQADMVANLPLIVQLHFLNAFVLVALFPFSRLVHILPYPITYLWRPYQVVVWNQRRIQSGKSH